MAYGLVVPVVDKSVLYTITVEGAELAGRFTAIYARSYRLAAEIPLRRLSRLSDKALRESVREWITIGQDDTRPEVLDLLDSIASTYLPPLETPPPANTADDETGPTT